MFNFAISFSKRISASGWKVNAVRFMQSSQHFSEDLDDDHDDMNDDQGPSKFPTLQSAIYNDYSDSDKAKFAAYKTKLHEMLRPAAAPVDYEADDEAFIDGEKEDDDDDDEEKQVAPKYKQNKKNSIDDEDEDMTEDDDDEEEEDDSDDDDDDSDDENDMMMTQGLIKNLQKSKLSIERNISELQTSSSDTSKELAGLKSQLKQVKLDLTAARDDAVDFHNTRQQSFDAVEGFSSSKMDFATLNESIFRMIESDNRESRDLPTGRGYLGSHKDDARFKWSDSLSKGKDARKNRSTEAHDDEDDEDDDESGRRGDAADRAAYNRNTHILHNDDDADVEERNQRPFRGVGARSKSGARIDQMTDEDEEKQMRYIYDKYDGKIRPVWNPEHFSDADNLCLHILNESHKTDSGLVAEMHIAKPISDKKKLAKIIPRARNIRELLVDQAMPPLAIPTSHFMYHHFETAWMLLCRQADCSLKERVEAMQKVSRDVLTWPETSDPNDPIWDSNSMLWACKAAEYNVLARTRVKQAILNHVMDSNKDASIMSTSMERSAELIKRVPAPAVEGSSAVTTYKDEDEMERVLSTKIGNDDDGKRKKKESEGGVKLAKNRKPKHTIAIDISNVNPSRRAWMDEKDEEADYQNSNTKEKYAMKARQKELEKKKK